MFETFIRGSMRPTFALAGCLAAVVTLSGCGTEAAPTPPPTGAAAAQALPLGPEAQIFGAWRPEPFALPALLVSKMDAACRASMAPFPAGVELVVVDVRGESVAQLYYAGANGNVANCSDVWIGATGAVQALGGGSTGLGPRPGPIAPGDLTITDQSGTGRRPNLTKSYLAGRAGGAIASVILVLKNGVVARATLRNGWWAVWFPGDVSGGRVKGLDALGSEVATSEAL